MDFLPVQLQPYSEVITLTVVLIAGWFLVRAAFRLTATLFRLGCALIFLLAAGLAAFQFLS